jgi:hypothetical protein
VRKDGRVRGYFSKPIGAREQTSLENARKDVAAEETKHVFIPCQQKVRLDQNIRLCNNCCENVATSIHFKYKKEIKHSLVIRYQNVTH